MNKKYLIVFGTITISIVTLYLLFQWTFTKQLVNNPNGQDPITSYPISTPPVNDNNKAENALKEYKSEKLNITFMAPSSFYVEINEHEEYPFVSISEKAGQPNLVGMDNAMNRKHNKIDNAYIKANIGGKERTIYITDKTGEGGGENKECFWSDLTYWYTTKVNDINIALGKNEGYMCDERTNFKLVKIETSKETWENAIKIVESIKFL